MTDARLAPDAQAILDRIRGDFEFYAPRHLWILTKAGQIQPLQLNEAQRTVHRRLEQQLSEQGMVRALVLKGRQQGISTYTEGRYFHKTSLNPGLRAYILTHRDDATSNLFGIAKRYYDLCPPQLRPALNKSNAKELEFASLLSDYKVATAGGKGAGRSTTVQLFHGSEVGFWPNAEEHLAGVGQTVPLLPGTEMILESTANGVNNVFHTLWEEAVRGEGLYVAIFVPWFWQREYALEVPPDFALDDPEDREYRETYQLSLEQMAWRAHKLKTEFLGDVALFNQEYPATADLAFQRVAGEPFIRSEWVAKARRGTFEASGPLVMGVDPAELGADQTAIAFRRGRRCEPVQTWGKRNTMEVAGIAAHLIEQREPDAVFVDAVGIGSGVYARLVELLPRVMIHRVMSGESATEDDRYANKRAELWGRLRDWLEDGAALPDEDALHSQLTAVQWGFDSSGRIRLEKKEQMKKRGVKSPDLADALALTFALPVQAKQAPQATTWRQRLRQHRPTARSWMTA